MRQIPRDSWLEWCELETTSPTHHLEVADPGFVPGIVRRIDFAPFDDILEIDIERGEGLQRELVDHPLEILEQEAASPRLVIRWQGGSMCLVRKRNPVSRPSRPGASDDLPDALRGSYFEG